MLDYSGLAQIGIGSAPNDGTGDTLRAGGGKINLNADEFVKLLKAGAVHEAVSSGTWPEGSLIAAIGAGMGLAQHGVRLCDGMALKQSTGSGNIITFVSDGVVELIDWTPIAGTGTLALGATYWLSNSPGKMTTVKPPNGQRVGIGISANQFLFQGRGYELDVATKIETNDFSSIRFSAGAGQTVYVVPGTVRKVLGVTFNGQDIDPLQVNVTLPNVVISPPYPVDAGDVVVVNCV